MGFIRTTALQKFTYVEDIMFLPDCIINLYKKGDFGQHYQLELLHKDFNEKRYLKKIGKDENSENIPHTTITDY